MPNISFEKPRPRPPKAEPASRTLTVGERKALAAGAEYVGSPHHTNIPKYGMKAAPRQGHVTIEKAESDGLKNPSCTVCPPKWVRRQADATKLLVKAIEDGNFVSEGAQAKPSRLWARDPDDPNLIYEAKLCSGPNEYKAYPLTSFQANFNLPIVLP